MRSLLGPKFGQASSCANHVGLSDLCRYNIDGARVENPVFPYAVKLYSPKIQFPSEPVTHEELQNLLTNIPANSHLFDIYAFDSPQNFKNDVGILLGSITTNSECVNSQFGDTRLLFRHQRYLLFLKTFINARAEDDWKLRKDWFDALDAEEDCGSSSISLELPRKCPLSH